MLSPEVSIIIPHYNRSVLIKQTIFYVKHQTFKNWEIIIVDDGSDINEYEELTKLSENNIHIFRQANNKKGPSAARNLGVDKASGKYIIFLDSDDLLAPYCLCQRVDYLKKHPQFEMVVFNMKQFYESPEDIKHIYNKHYSDNQTVLRQFLRLNIPWQLTSVIWHKALVKKLGAFNESMMYAEDPELHARAFMHYPELINIVQNSRPDSYYRMPTVENKSSALDISRSVKGRIDFIKSMHNEIINSNVSNHDKSKYLKDLKLAYKNVVSLFFNDSKFPVPNEFLLFQEYCYKNFIISKVHKTFSSYALKIWQRESFFVRMLRLKGIISTLYLQK